MRLVLIVPTRNRPEQLAKLMSFVGRQTVSPDLVLVVDGSDPHHVPKVERTVRDLQARFEIDLVRVPHPSLPGQRNAGIAELKRKVSFPEFVVFLDDDVEPEPDYLERLLVALEGDETVGGASGVSQDENPSRPWWRRVLAKAFGYGEGAPGSVMRSGINIPVPAYSEGPVESEWLFGCSMWRGEIFDSFKFTELASGYVLYEDVEFSVRVGKRWKLLVDPGARLIHNQVPVSSDHLRKLAYQSIVNRYFVVRHCLGRPGGVLAFWWSTLGLVLFTGITAVASRDARTRLHGFLRGIWGLVSRRVVFPRPC